MFWPMLRAATLAGIVAGVLLTALQAWSVAPLIRDAERIEQAAGRDEAPDAWQPGTDTTRVAATAVANVVLATGFALMLSGAMALHDTARTPPLSRSCTVLSSNLAIPPGMLVPSLSVIGCA